MTEKKRDITELSLDEICDIAAQAGQEAGMDSLQAGLEVVSQELETGRFYIEKIGEGGQIVKNYITDEELEKRSGEGTPDE
ncbi:hypothetical protein [Sessilibacter corallicola]|uniref:hypothetical protein n=1 Tax=Sessilibacter corallicola TaxID=2904075 RepID=UPI001E567C36|nr:hypothetical protein [Sessilibacter corallicola]MCE2028009.1 hypothetical protein [Sessilibacter corallicola]